MASTRKSKKPQYKDPFIKPHTKSMQERRRKERYDSGWH